MESLKTILIVVQIISAFAVIGLVLMQHGKGADMGAAFGSGSSGSLFGATGSANFLSRLTAVFATVFFIATIGITWMGINKVSKRRSALQYDSPTAGSACSDSATSPSCTNTRSEYSEVTIPPEPHTWSIGDKSGKISSLAVVVKLVDTLS